MASLYRCDTCENYWESYRADGWVTCRDCGTDVWPYNRSDPEESDDSDNVSALSCPSMYDCYRCGNTWQSSYSEGWLTCRRCDAEVWPYNKSSPEVSDDSDDEAAHYRCSHCYNTWKSYRVDGWVTCRECGNDVLPYKRPLRDARLQQSSSVSTLSVHASLPPLIAPTLNLPVMSMPTILHVPILSMPTQSNPTSGPTLPSVTSRSSVPASEPTSSVPTPSVPTPSLPTPSIARPIIPTLCVQASTAPISDVPASISTPTPEVPIPSEQKKAVATSSLATGGSDSKPEQLKVDCKICLEGSVEMVFTPCGHICACSSCAQRVTSCPLCRQAIERSVKFYLS